MKHLLLAAALAVAAIPATAQEKRGTARFAGGPIRAFMGSGQQLLDMCEGNAQDRKVCEGYIVGFADASMLESHAQGVKGCIAETTNREQVIAKALGRLRDVGPEMRKEYPASVLVDMFLNSCADAPW
jgi:hypothetical protein